ncbi:MAG: DUF6714 family protein [Elainellaceae cyanobacterium]
MGDRYACRCCGYLTLPTHPSGTWEICPVCFWEDAPLGKGWISNQISLRQAQRSFIQVGASDQEWLGYVRSPEAAESRAPDWQTLDEQDGAVRKALIEDITLAFQAVRRADGVTLHQARVLDDYGGAEEQARARALDTDTHWGEVPDEWITEFSEALCFVDPIGFRYYIPAYMIWTLKHYTTSHSFSVDSTIYAFCLSQNLEAHQLSYFSLLDTDQCQVICRFLMYCVKFGGHFLDSRAAQEALDKHWQQFCQGM